jgi:hypothetical protein
MCKCSLTSSTVYADRMKHAPLVHAAYLGTPKIMIYKNVASCDTLVGVRLPVCHMMLIMIYILSAHNVYTPLTSMGWVFCHSHTNCKGHFYPSVVISVSFSEVLRIS